LYPKTYASFKDVQRSPVVGACEQIGEVASATYERHDSQEACPLV
jgi:hypothetical protein